MSYVDIRRRTNLIVAETREAVKASLPHLEGADLETVVAERIALRLVYAELDISAEKAGLAAMIEQSKRWER